LLNDGAWWEVTLASSPPSSVQPQPRDAILAAGLADLPPSELYGRTGVYAKDKRQLSSKETKALKLRD
jgi:hypothetical protein